MISRQTLGLLIGMGAPVAAFGVLGRDPTPLVPDEYRTGLTNELCLGGRPRKRSPDITYGGLPVCPTAERSHIVPLCLGGPDTRDNLEYQPWAQAHPDDERERQTCEAYCRGEITLDAARAQFHRTYGLTCPQ